MLPNPIEILNDVFLTSTPSKTMTPIVLPADELMHEYPVEWWYFVAHLNVAGSYEKLAVEMTALRLRARSLPAFDTCYIAVMDLKNQKYVSADRQSERAYDQGANHLLLRFPAPVGQPGEWRIEGAAPTAPIRYELEGAFQAGREQRAVRLVFRDVANKPVLLHGNAGVLQLHGLDLGYYSRTRLAVTGGLKINGRHVLVDGSGWMDHEYGAADLPNSRWTFLAIQLDTNEELCVYRVERKDPPDPGVTFGYLVDSGNNSTVANPVTMTAGGAPWGTWKYPLTWDVNATFPGGIVKSLRVEAEFPEQRRVPTGEPALPFVTFWEGAAKVIDLNNYNQVGRAFLEMAGYE